MQENIDEDLKRMFDINQNNLLENNQMHLEKEFDDYSEERSDVKKGGNRSIKDKMFSPNDIYKTTLENLTFDEIFSNNIDPMKYKRIENKQKKVIRSSHKQNCISDIQNAKNYDYYNNSSSLSDKKVFFNANIKKIKNEFKNNNNNLSSKDLSNINIQNVDSHDFDSVNNLLEVKKSRRKTQKKSKIILLINIRIKFEYRKSTRARKNNIRYRKIS